MESYRKIGYIWGILFLIVGQCYAKDINLTWEHDGDCTEYRIYRGEANQTGWPTLVGTVPCTVRRFADVDVPRGDLHWIATSYWDGLESNPSNEEFYAFYYPRVKYENDDRGHILFKGENANYAAVDDDTTWVITKYYYDLKWLIVEIRVREGSWTNRVQGW
jgi:hypothetical protein